MADSISEIKKEYNNLKEDEYNDFIVRYSEDDRSGVISLVKKPPER